MPVYDDKFFIIRNHSDALIFFIIRNHSESSTMFRVYSGDVSSAIPFTWETRPGTPKHVSSENSHIPPNSTPLPTTPTNSPIPPVKPPDLNGFSTICSEK
ncbi:hypothetical protein ACS0TY_028885 [Phlomoides rotata]